MKSKPLTKEVYEFYCCSKVDAGILLDILKRIKTKESFTVYNKGRYFKVTFLQKRMKKKRLKE